MDLNNHPFSYDAITSAVRSALADANVPAEHRIAFVTTANQNGIISTIAIRVGDEWQIKAYADIERNHGFEYGTQVQWTR